MLLFLYIHASVTASSIIHPNKCIMFEFHHPVSRHRLQHPLCPAGPVRGFLALQIQDGKTSAGHLGAAVGHQLLSHG